MTFREFFADKIDWKFFNFLMDRTTKYQDIGCSVKVSVLIKNGNSVNSEYTKVFCYYSSSNQSVYFDEFYDDKELKVVIPRYEKRGLFYGVSIDALRDDETYDYSKTHYMDEFIEEMSKYCDVNDVMMSTFGFILLSKK